MKQLKICLPVLALAFFMTACQQDTLEGIDYLNADENLEERAFCPTPPASALTFGNGSYQNLYVYAHDYNGVVHQIRWRVRAIGNGTFTPWKTLKMTTRHYNTLPYMLCKEYEVQIRERCTPTSASNWSQAATIIAGDSNGNSCW